MTDSNHDALNADSSTLVRQSVWCGAVCALAVVLTTLNMYPPINVQYKVFTRAVISPARLEQLKSVLEKDRKIIASGRLRYAQLFKLKTLDESKNDGLLLVELESLWTGRATPAHIEAWLATVTKTEPRKLVDTAEAREERFARWQADAAKHYLKHHQYLCSCDKPGSSNVQLAGTVAPPKSGGIPAKFANLASGQEQGVQAIAVSGQLDFENPVVVEKKLVETLNQAEINVKKSEGLFVNALEKHAGAIEVVGIPQIRSKTSSIPTWMSASVLILALASGSIASLLQYRIQSGGAYDPKFVGNQLAIDGLPILAEVKLAPLGHETQRSPNRLLNVLKNTTGRHLAVIGENLMLIWCFAIACRMLFDPLWRSVAMDSPLAAFGRLVTGMP